ncbi:type II toxin-antitoxin system VapB family antitoxin [Sphingobium sp. Ndbn-10]|uniref:type II toxin-antitoxin system VapB family antitoxin n=1 Tax=Sphingobium sp. Ndbn-10 TaxID=1667223 RepID=UPI000AEB2E7A|nr:type II toxin-antitoxin system VapB family antitoxin [Sphingobium sp. Ndbn-10]
MSPTDPKLHERNGEEPGKKYIVRTNIVIDDDLMTQVLRTTGFKTKCEAVEAGLRLLLSIHSQAKLCSARGKLAWEGDLDTMRNDR